MGKLCPNCQFDNPEANTKCEVCGQDLSHDLPNNSFSQSAKSSEVLKGLNSLRLGYLIFVLEFIVSLVISIAIIRSSGYISILGPLGTLSSASSLDAITSYTNALVIYVVVGIVFSLLAYLLIYRGLKYLSNLKPSIGTGATGALLIFIGLILVAIFAVVSLFTFSSLITTTTTTSGSLTTTTSNIGLGILSVIPLIIGAVLVIVGIIMLTIGVFRVGSAFTSGSVEVGAILAIFISIVGYIIILLGLSGIIKRLRLSNQSPTEI